MLDYDQIEFQAKELQRSFLDRAAKRHLEEEFLANRPALAQRICYWIGMKLVCWGKPLHDQTLHDQTLQSLLSTIDSQPLHQ